MKVYTNTNSSFPSQVVSDAVKASYDYGLQVSRAIEQEWFDQGRTNQIAIRLVGTIITN